MRLGRVHATLCALLLCLWLPNTGAAQTTGGITGVARDTTGAILPGVTVEAASPALIEKVRVAVTDGQGRFNITDLRPGVYSVTFQLTGFASYKREGIELVSGFTATANADMKVGGLEETITVSGASPIVDIQNVRTQNVMKFETIESLPSGGRDLSQFASLTLGATASTQGRNDVGGALVDLNTSVVLHGGRGDDSKINYDGMNTNGFWSGGGGQMRIWKFNTIGVQETVVDTGGADAETETGGANINMVPRDGGNTFSVRSILAYANQDMASGKVPASLVARGSAAQSKSLKKVYDYGIGLGGPIVQDRLWFFNANRMWGGQGYGANNFFNKSTVPYRYEADLSRPAFTDSWLRDIGGRFTLQASQKHKLTTSLNWQRACSCDLGISLGARESPEAGTDFQYGLGIPGGGMWNSQTTWSYPSTNRLLLQAGASFLIQTVSYTDAFAPNPRITEQTTGYSWGGQGGGTDRDWVRPQGSNNFSQRFSLSYITGSHALKTGFQSQQGAFESWGNALPSGVNYTFRNGVPLQITQFASPFENRGIIRRYGLFASDQWTINKLTLNLGIRYDGWSLYTEGRTVPAGPFTAARTVPEAKNLPGFKDITPRLGFAYDLFGNGKTAIKGSWGKYLMGLGGGDAAQLSPANSIIQNTQRLWGDANGDFTPDCDLRNLQANGECGTVANLAFGQPVSATVWDEASRTGWGVREFSHRYSLAVQHELAAGLGLMVSYNRTDWKNQQAVVNNAFTPADFTPFCVTTPTDTRLGDYGGQRVCGLYDVDPAKFGRVNAVRMRVQDIPGVTDARPKEIFNGIDIALNARFGQGGVLQGGITFGRTTFDYCWLNNLPHVVQVGMPGAVANRETTTSLMPRQEGYCKIETPWMDGVGSQAKIQAVYPMPFGFVASGTWKNQPGIALPADLVVTNAVARTSLGRDLALCRGAVGAACTATATVAALPYANAQGNYSAALFDSRLNEIDLRFTRRFRFGGLKLEPVFEIYNVTNNRPAQGVVTTFGPAYKFPFALLGGRLFKFGATIDY